MHDLLPEGEELRRAVKWVSAQLQEHPDQPISPLVSEATFRFDLSPRESELLAALYRRQPGGP